MTARALVLALAVACVALAAHRHAAARAEAAREVFALEAARAAAAELDALLARPRALVLAEPPPRAGVAALAARALVDAGLPASVLAAADPEPTRAADAGPGAPLALARGAARLTLAGLALHELGAFLDAWRRAHPAWTVTSIDLAPLGRERTPDGHQRVRAVVTVESITESRTP